MNQRRFIPWTWLFALAALTGCATRASISPDAVVLQDPLPGQGLVYLLRAPYDDKVIRVEGNGVTLVVLPPGRHTALSLQPGKYVLTTFASSLFSPDVQVAPPLELSLLPDQRLFYAISGTTEQAIAFTGITRAGPSLFLPTFSYEYSTASNTRSWKEVAELDARGLMTMSRVVLPER